MKKSTLSLNWFIITGSFLMLFGFTCIAQAEEEFVGAISGNVSVHIDGDFIIEIPIENVVLELLDGNGDPVLDTFRNPVSTTTNVNGDYIFVDVQEGEYQIVENQPDGFEDQSEVDGGDDGDHPDNGITNNIPVTVSRNEIDTGNNFIEGLNFTAVSLQSNVTEQGSNALLMALIVFTASIFTWTFLNTRRQI